MTHRDPVQMNLLQGLEFKESGMEQAIQTAYRSYPEWKDAFVAAIERLASYMVPFTSEDVIAVCGLPTGQIRDHANGAVGALINAAARRGVIRKTGRRVPSKRPSSHGADLAEWIGVRR